MAVFAARLPKWQPLKFWGGHVDNSGMSQKSGLTTGGSMIQWIGVLIGILGLAYTGFKDYQKGDIKIPTIQKPLTVVKYPIQYCLMAHDPNLKKVFYLHENGQWYDFPPKIREYPDQGQEALGNPHGTQGVSGHSYGQQAQATPYPIRR